MKKTQNRPLIATFALLIITASVAHAGESKDEEAKELRLFNQATISLTDAIKAAEQKTSGKAIEAEVDDEASSIQFEIKILKEGKIEEVLVDGKTGMVAKAAKDNESTEHEKE